MSLQTAQRRTNPQEQGRSEVEVPRQPGEPHDEDHLVRGYD
ncbi:hypothetical protein ABT337_02940 [Saccharopolyspora hirsuta]|nr:hypothetical protein [Saccharopolyspora hirsuta]